MYYGKTSWSGCYISKNVEGCIPKKQDTCQECDCINILFSTQNNIFKNSLIPLTNTFVFNCLDFKASQKAIK